MNRGVQFNLFWDVPRTVDHSDSIVCWDSYIVMVNPELEF
jgi:hypothetical protein